MKKLAWHVLRNLWAADAATGYKLGLYNFVQKFWPKGYSRECAPWGMR